MFVRRIRIKLDDDRKGMNTLWLCISTFLAEFLGTAILIFLGCMGEMYGWEKVGWNNMQGGVVFGIAVLLSIQVFGPVSGAHINPVVTLAEWIIGLISLPLSILYIIAQLIGGIAAMAVLRALTPDEILINSMKEPSNVTAFCVVSPTKEVTLVQGFFVEFLATFMLIMFCLGTWDKRNSGNQDSIAVKFAAVVAALSIAAGPYSGASMNPARALGPAVIFNSWDDHWIYWVAPITASLLACLIHIFIFEGPTTKEADMVVNLEIGGVQHNGMNARSQKS